MVSQTYQCPVCGYGMQDPPRDNNICPSCGTEFGYDDAGRTFSDIRDAWLRIDAPWSSRVAGPPNNWNAYVQMLSAGLIDIKLESDAGLKIVDPAGESLGVTTAPASGVV
jgi:hypothetical protein